MVKYFCDGCHIEIPNTANRSTFSGKSPKGVDLKVEVMVTVGKTTNGGHICADCIKSTVATGTYNDPSLR